MTLPGGADLLPRADGAARLAFAAAGTGAGAGTRLVDLYQRSPCRALFPHVPAGEPPQAVLLTTTGGLTGGDRVAIAVTAGPGSAATVTSQAAEKLYRSTGADAEIGVTLTVGADAWLEWLPQETILFQGARLKRRTEAHLDPAGRLLAVESLVFGRQAMGETFTAGAVRESWRILRDGSVIWADALGLSDAEIPWLMSHPAAFAGARAYATVLYVGPDSDAWLVPARSWLAEEDRWSGVTVINGVLLARFLNPDVRVLRGQVAAYLARARAAIMGFAEAVPRVWGL